MPGVVSDVEPEIMSIEVELLCSERRCNNDVNEHYYCQECFDEKLKEEYDRGYEEGKNSNEEIK